MGQAVITVVFFSSLLINKIETGGPGGIAAFMFIILVRETLSPARLMSFSCLILFFYNKQF